MRADTKENKPLWALNTVVIMLLMTQGCRVNCLLFRNFFCSTMTNKEGFSTPLKGNALALGYVAQFYLDFCKRKNIGRCTHAQHKLLDEHLRSICCRDGTS